MDIGIQVVMCVGYRTALEIMMTHTPELRLKTSAPSFVRPASTRLGSRWDVLVCEQASELTNMTQNRIRNSRVTQQHMTTNIPRHTTI